jgi:hypothetical protein
MFLRVGVTSSVNYKLKCSPVLAREPRTRQGPLYKTVRTPRDKSVWGMSIMHVAIQIKSMLKDHCFRVCNTFHIQTLLNILHDFQNLDNTSNKAEPANRTVGTSNRVFKHPFKQPHCLIISRNEKAIHKSQTFALASPGRKKSHGLSLCA